MTRASNGIQVPDRVCANEDCGAWFRPKRPDQQTCCVECRNAVTARKSAAKRGAMMRGKNTTGRGRYPKYGGRVAHQVVLEQVLGRPISSKEAVHHLDGDTTNWSPYNLVYFPSHAGHARCEKQGADKAKARGQRVLTREEKRIMRISKSK